MTTRRKPTGRSRRRGVAMIETVLTLPFIFVLIALIMYCGVTMLRWHRVSTVDRYEAWRAIAYAPGPSAAATGESTGFDASQLGQSFFPVAVQANPDAPETPAVRDPYGLDQLSISVRRGLGTGRNQDPALTHLANAVATDTTSASATLFDFLFYNQTRPLPTTRLVEIRGQFSDRFGQSFAGEFEHTTSRIDSDWRYVNDALDMENEVFYDRNSDTVDVPLYNDDPDVARPQRIVSPTQGIWEFTFTGFNNRLGGLTAVNPLASELRDLSLRVPAYVGPKLPASAERLPNLDWNFNWLPAGE